MGLTDLWPLFGLRLRTPRLELLLPTDNAAELGVTRPLGYADPSPSSTLRRADRSVAAASAMATSLS